MTDKRPGLHPWWASVNPAVINCIEKNLCAFACQNAGFEIAAGWFEIAILGLCGLISKHRGRREYLFTNDSLTILTRTYTQNLLMFVPTPNKMYCCVLTNVVLVYITIIWPICPLQNITNLRLENSRQKFSPIKNSLQNLTYFQNVISNPEMRTHMLF